MMIFSLLLLMAVIAEQVSFNASNLNLSPILILFWLFILIKMGNSHSNSLTLLLLLEMMMLTLLLAAVSVFWQESGALSFFLTFFTLAVCEASFGLSLLMRVSRQCTQTHLDPMLFCHKPY